MTPNYEESNISRFFIIPNGIQTTREWVTDIHQAGAADKVETVTVTWESLTWCSEDSAGGWARGSRDTFLVSFDGGGQEVVSACYFHEEAIVTDQ